MTLRVGWAKSKSGELVYEKDVKSKFQKGILAHVFIGLIGKKLVASS